jgi:hypothetical protein
MNRNTKNIALVAFGGSLRSPYWVLLVAGCWLLGASLVREIQIGGREI